MPSLLPRALASCLLSGSLLAGTARAQDPTAVYQRPRSVDFKLDALLRQEWTEEITFTEKDRRLARARPRVEVNLGPLQLGAGGDFTYGDDNTVDAAGAAVPLMRDNYDAREARLDLAWARLEPFSQLSVQGGRFFMPVRFTEMIWDRDLRPQGASATLALSNVGPAQRLSLTGVLARGSHILPQDHPFELEERDTLWIGSAAAVFPWGTGNRLELTGSYLKFEDLEFVPSVIRRQNTRQAGVLVLPYEVVDVVARYRSEGRVNTQLVADYCWNTAVDESNRGLWLAVILGSTVTARGSLEYTYASVDKDATLAAYPADDFLWHTGWAGHRLELAVRMGEHVTSHAIGQLQRFKDAPRVEDREDWKSRARVEVRINY